MANAESYALRVSIARAAEVRTENAKHCVERVKARPVRPKPRFPKLKLLLKAGSMAR